MTRLNGGAGQEPKGSFATVATALRLIERPRRIRLAGVAMFSLVVSGLEAISAVLVLVLLRLVLGSGSSEVPVVDRLQGLVRADSQSEFVFVFSVLFALFFLLRGAAFLFQQYVLTRVTENTGVVLAQRLFDSYLSMPYEFHLRRNSSELIRNAQDSTLQIAGAVFSPLAAVFAESVLVLMMLGVLIAVSPIATLAAAAIMGLAVAMTLKVIQPRIRDAGTQRHDSAKVGLQHLQQGLGGLRDVKVLGREDTFIRSFVQSRKDLATAHYRQATLMYVPRTMIETVFLLVVLVLLVLATANGEPAETLSTLGLFAYAGLRIQPSLQKIAYGLNSLKWADTPVETIRSELEALGRWRDARREADEDVRPLSFTQAIEFRDVSFTYAGASRPALSELNLAIRHGESVGVCGQTGGGKSTFIDLLCGLLEPSDGSIEVDGQDMGQHVRAWQRNIGIVHQTSFLVDDTLRRNIALGVPDGEVDEDALARAVEIAQLSEVVEALPDGLGTIVGERGVLLSGGQRQRVTLARALYRQPRLLILDEGTSALDNDTEAAVIRALDALRAQLTLVMVAHRLTTIQACDRILFLEDGRLQAIGPYEELKSQEPRFRAIAV